MKLNVLLMDPRMVQYIVYRNLLCKESLRFLRLNIIIIKTCSHLWIDNFFVTVISWVTIKLYVTNFVRKNRSCFTETRIVNDTLFCYASLSVAGRIIVLIIGFICPRISNRYKRIISEWVIGCSTFNISVDKRTWSFKRSR